MHSVQTGLWNPRPPSKHASPIPAPPPFNSRPAHVTSTTPAKRITFYKSGDSQFGGVRMAIHKRSFKCFDALLDDLSQKVPLPFGVRTVTTPRGIHTIKHLEQLQDGGCYLCSDRRQAKPVNMELVNKQSGIWYHHSQRPHRPEISSTTPPGHLHTPYRQRRILLVKNSEPGMRRSVVLSRRSARSLRAFLDEVSEVMQFHVRKLYTAEGRRIDSVQSLMTCPGVLVCVGREAFSPMLINFIRKSSEEKLPGLGSRSPGLGPRTPGNGARSPATQGVRSPPHGAQSRASEYSEGRESKKNVNFGLETKKSIIHPRSDSSNRSTRFSFSSEKSYGNGVSACPQAKPAIMNDDIEKRVLVNKDGSLSVEMRVRFRLQSDETLQWSTQIKKSPSLTNEYSPLSQAQPHYLQQGQSESCSDPDSTSFDQEGVDYSSQPLQCELEGNRCPCYHQRHEQQYDLWENPAHIHKTPPVPPTSNIHTMMRHTHSSSSSSSCNSRRVVRCRAGLSSCGGGSGSEQSQLVQEEMCMTEQVEHRLEVEQDGDTHVEVRKVSRCCSRSEVVVMDSNLRPLSRKSAEEEEDRPLSAVSSSSHVLRSLKEDQDDEDDDLPPSVSRCCHGNEPSPTPDNQLHEKPKSNVSAASFQSVKHKEREERGSGVVSAVSSCPCGEATTNSGGPNEEDQVLCTTSTTSETRLPELDEGGAGDDDEMIKRAISGFSGHTGLSESSQKSGTSSVCPNCGGCKRKVNSVSSSRASHRSNHSNRASPNRASPVPNDADDAASDVSTQSNKTNLTNNGRLSATSNILEGKVSSAMSGTSSPKAEGKEEERAPSATISHRSNRSRNSGCKGTTDVSVEKEEERSPSVVSNQSAKSSKSKHTTEAPDISSSEKAEGEYAAERAVSSLSARSCVSAKTNASVKSCNSNCQSSTKGASRSDDPAVEECDANKRAPSGLSVKSGKAERPDSAKSKKSNISVKSSTSHRSWGGNCAKAAAGEATIKVTGQEVEIEVEERATSAMSAKSNLSAKSNKSHKSTKASEGSEAGGDGEERAPSQMSGTSVKSDKSIKSTKSSKSKCNGNEMVASSSSKTADEAEENNEVETQPRPDSTMLVKSESNERAPSAGSFESQKSSCNQNTELSSEIGPNTGNQEDGEKRTASALSHKSASSAKSHNAKIEGEMVDRAPSTKSSKSQKSDHTTASPVPSEAKENQERVASVMSAKSKSSVRSRTSHKSSSSTNVAAIKTPVADDKEENVTKERAPSAASGTSNVSSAVSQKSNYNRKADITVIETADGDEKVANTSAPKIKSSEHCNLQTLSPKRTRSPQVHSPDASAASTKSSKSLVQQLLNGSGAGETRGASALSVHSTTSAKSAKSGKSKCCCGAASESDRAKREKGDEDKEVKLEVNSEKASERAASALSSEGMDQPLSHNSIESVSLGLPEEASDSDSGKSSVHRSAEDKAENWAKTATPDLPKDPEVSTVKEDVEITGSTESQKSNSTGRKSGSAVDIPTIETPASEEYGVQKTEKAASTISVKSSRSNKSSCNCKAKEKHANASPTKVGNGSEAETAPMTNDSNDRNSSAMSSASTKVRSKPSASANAVTKTAAGQSANNDTENQENSRAASKAKGKEDNAYNEAISSQSPCCLRPESASLASEQSKGKDPVECHKAKFNTGSDCGSVKTANSKKKETSIKSSSPCPLHSKVETCSESTLSHSLSAADLLKETMAAARPCSQQSKASKSSDRSRSKKSGMCQRSSNQKDKGEELTPACLPNTSPSEVVSDWLRSIPTNSSMLALGDEFNEEELRVKEMEEIPEGEMAKESPEGEKIDKEEKDETEEDKEKEEEAKCDIAQEEKDSDPPSGEVEGASGRPSLLQLGSETLPRNWQSSAAVMKVLLSSSLGRCRSMPEVSPVYGRRLSTSARGLLDCLAQLQLIEPAVSPGYEPEKGRSQQYEDIMAILHSLWLTEPGNNETKEAKENKDSSPEQVTPPRSSSGVDMSSGSGGSGKENGNQGGNETPPKEREFPNAHEVAEKAVEEQEEENAKAGDTEFETEHKETFTEQAKADTAEEPEQSEDVLQRMESPKPSESSDKTSAEGGSKSPTDNERETLEESSPGTPPTVLRAPLAKRLSQDPDPVWVLHLLKKLEKQFMAHYINAMADFKVRWDLDDSLILDTMITELKDEVSRRIQSSIEREMRKIQSRAGRGGRSPRPPQGTNLSRESTTTEKRRRMLKVMKNQSVKTGDSLSDGETTGDFSDQRSDDEYCPCEACVRKKMAARPFNTNPLATEAPVMKDFDLLKILQLKKSPGPAPATAPQPVDVEGEHLVADDDGRNLDVVQEEEEEDETKDDIRAAVVLEETIAEEDEEAVQEKDEGETREEEEPGDEQEEEEESSAVEEEQEEERTSGEEAREDDASGNEEEEEESQCKCARNEEESDQEEEGEGQTGEHEGETGEDETEENEGEMETSKEEEETSDQETIKEATVGKGETTENGESDEEVDEKENTTDSKSEEEEDDSAVKTTENEQSALVEEVTEGNISASAEDEYDGEDGTGEEEEESTEDRKEGESEEQEGEASEEERTSPQGENPAVCTTEGEEADAEDSDADSKRPRDTGADESGCEEKEESGGDRDEEEDAVKEFKPEEEDEDEEKAYGNKSHAGALLHQVTRTSVESQPGSLDDIDTDSPQNLVDSIEVPKMADSIGTGGGKGQRRSRSPARVKRRKPKEGDDELDSF